MKNLYKLDLIHFAPKDSQRGIFCFIVAENDKEVFNLLSEDFKINQETFYTRYDSLEYLYEDEEVYNDVVNSIIENQGLYNTDYAEDFLTDLYYGATLESWELFKGDITPNQIELLQYLGIPLLIQGESSK